MKRTPLRRKTPLRARSSLRSGSPRRPSPSKKARKPGVPEDVALAVIRRSGGICERCEKKPGTELHHRVTRGRGGPHDEFNLVHLCQTCHHVHAHGQNEYPWLVPGRFIRGVYYGPDETYQQQYPAVS